MSSFKPSSGILIFLIAHALSIIKTLLMADVEIQSLASGSERSKELDMAFLTTKR